MIKDFNQQFYHFREFCDMMNRRTNSTPRMSVNSASSAAAASAGHSTGATSLSTSAYEDRRSHSTPKMNLHSTVTAAMANKPTVMMGSGSSEAANKEISIAAKPKCFVGSIRKKDSGLQQNVSGSVDNLYKNGAVASDTIITTKINDITLS